MAAENAFQSTLLVFLRALQWDAEAAGTSYLTVVVMGRWLETRSSPTVHSVPVGQALLTAVMSGVLRPLVPLFTHVAVPSLRMLAFWERSQSSNSSPSWSAGWCSSRSGGWALRSPPARKKFPGSVGGRARVS